MRRLCGITGWIDWDQDLTRRAQVLEGMTDTLACRGPDAAGVWLSPNAGLGHRRLAVIDPENGAQPMVRRIGEHTCVISYNGELYNTAELRRELEARGQRFETHCDTEVLLAAYMEWGADCLERLNGIFAFAVWDESEQRLFMARDRFGVKPLFYARRGEALLFGSEPKALLANPLVRPEVDAEGLAEVFAMLPARTPGHGVYRGVRELRPGFQLEWDRRGLRVARYWELESRPHTDSLEATAARVRELLEDAVVRQLVSDVPICTLLSGGLDSSAISAFAAGELRRQGRGPLVTFSIDFVNSERDFRPTYYYHDPDAPWVRRVSEFLGTDHREVRFDTAEQVDHLATAVRARDLPGWADIDSSLYLFCREIKRQATVSVSGETADEIFGGYPWFHEPAALAADTFPWSRKLAARSSVLSAEVRGWLRPEEYVSERYHEALAEVPRLPGESPLEARIRELFHLNYIGFMAALLERKDRMSMASGLEVRVPFCDHRLAQYVWNIPWSMKCCDGQRKGILRRAVAGVLPDDVVYRKKSPYPKTTNPSYLAAVRDRVLEILNDPTSPLVPLLDVPRVRALAAEGAEDFPGWFGQTMAGPQLFAYLYMVDLWLREYRVAVV